MAYLKSSDSSSTDTQIRFSKEDLRMLKLRLGGPLVLRAQDYFVAGHGLSATELAESSSG